ncbi:hypothetical protein LP414_32500 [Polaromonas sp. P1(28)-13]|nr:hypothetical protein LP414_32500 [Polaromonas sp. P1(28)-13]
MNAKLQTMLLAAVVSAATVFAQTTEPMAKVLSEAEDATQKTVLIGRASTGNMIVIFELEAAKSMWMRMGNPSKWVEHPVGKGEIFHVEVKPVDPKSKTRIPYADVKFSADQSRQQEENIWHAASDVGRQRLALRGE